MTAIAGVWRFDGRPDADDACTRMLATQRFYGPHDSAQWSDGAFAVGRQLFRILPEDEFDRQPLIGGGGRYVLVADIRLDNREELSGALGISAANASSLCDAAILLAAFERWHEDCLKHLIGDYAFAVWDSSVRRLFLARDPTGQRPLHFHRNQSFFAFSSMPKGLHALPEVPYAPDEERIAERLLLIAEAGTQSFFKGVERIPPGHAVAVTADAVEIRQYWQPKRKQIRLRSPDEYAETLRALLDEAVRCRLRGTGDVGAYLSGGLDSGGVTATAARLLAPSGRRVIAFTATPRKNFEYRGLRDRIIDEGPYAAATAALYPNVEHVVVPNEGASPVAHLDRNFYLYDRPSNGLTNAAWSRSLESALAKRSLRVVLGGECGNMGLSFDGRTLLPELLQSGRWLHLLKEARALVKAGEMGWRGAVLNTLGPWCPPALWIWLHRLAKRDLDEPSHYSAINPRRLAEFEQTHREIHDFLYRPWKDGFAMRLWSLQRIDLGNFRKGILGGWKIDHRDPTSDVRLLEFCLGVPTEQFLRDGVPRALGLRTLSDRLPKMVLEERLRGHQVADWYMDLTAGRAELNEELERIEGCYAATSALDIPRLRGLLTNWPVDGWEKFEVLMPYRYAMPRAIEMGHFIRRATRSNR